MAIVSRASGVIAGRACAVETFPQIDPTLEVTWRIGDGVGVGPGDRVAEVSGALRSILTAERTVLNFLGHLSGVATLTRRYVDAVEAANPATRVLDTRKTTPGLRALEKAAVRAGGGHNHRGSLSDAVLVKDNHLGGLSIAEAVARARRGGRAGWWRSSATARTRWTRRSRPAPPWSCWTTCPPSRWPSACPGCGPPGWRRWWRCPAGSTWRPPPGWPPPAPTSSRWGP